MLAYAASKNEAEHAMTIHTRKKKAIFSLSTVLPGYVYSAIVPTPESLDKLKAASSANLFVSYFYRRKPDILALLFSR